MKSNNNLMWFLQLVYIIFTSEIFKSAKLKNLYLFLTLALLNPAIKQLIFRGRFF
jgi:hypothetical protein